MVVVVVAPATMTTTVRFVTKTQALVTVEMMMYRRRMKHFVPSGGAKFARTTPPGQQLRWPGALD